jgi:hypothetical protein
MRIADSSAMHRSLSLSLLAAAFVLAPTAQAYERLPRALAALSPADFANQVRIADDPADGAVVLSTRDGYARGRAVRGAPVDDVHLRAVVDRISGRATWQVWHDLVTVSGYKNVVAVEYVSGGMRRSTRPIAIHQSLGQCPPTDGAGFCNRITRIGFELPESAVRELAESYRSSSRTPWQIHFRDGAGKDVIGGIAPAEAAGLIAALEAWRHDADRDRAG